MKENRSIIHIYLKGENENHYFGSMSAMYDNLDISKIGIAYQSLRNFYHSKKTNVFENSFCIIRKSELICKETPARIRMSKNA